MLGWLIFVGSCASLLTRSTPIPTSFGPSIIRTPVELSNLWPILPIPCLGCSNPPLSLQSRSSSP
jgi:hypothetical protein